MMLHRVVVRGAAGAVRAPLRPPPPGPENDWHLAHVRMLDTSLHDLTGRWILGARPVATAQDAQALASDEDHVVVSHGAEADPEFNYATAAALQLWEVSWDDFVAMRSKYSAEAMEREERAALLARVREAGFVDTYSGVRVAASGRRFRISDAVIWNVHDASGTFAGQACVFRRHEVIAMDDKS